MDKQFQDLKLSKQEIENSLIKSGLWDTSEKKVRHSYILSPCVYLVTKKQQKELQQMALAIYSAVKKLDETITEIGIKPKTREEQELFSLANRASTGLAKPGELKTGIPPVLKVDLMQTVAGDFKIAEIDTYNPRGLAFMALLDQTVKYLNQPQYPGIKGFVELIQEDNFYYLYSEKELYYLPVFEVWQKILQKYGIKMTLIGENDLQKYLPKKVLIIPDTLTRCGKEVRTKLLQNCQTIYPPKAYLGSKAFLPFLKNCDGMNDHIPTTVLVSKKHHCFVDTGVLKAVMSSGMKNIYFSDLHSKQFSKQLTACKKAKKASWILQKQVPQKSYNIKIFDENGNIKIQKYFLRITAQITENGILGLDITGRPDRLVHGAPDCIQLPAILK